MSSTNTNTVIRMGNRKLLKQVFERCDCCPNIDFEHSPLFVLLETYAAIPPSKSGKLIHALQDILFVASKADNLSKVIETALECNYCLPPDFDTFKKRYDKAMYLYLNCKDVWDRALLFMTTDALYAHSWYHASICRRLLQTCQTKHDTNWKTTVLPTSGRPSIVATAVKSNMFSDSMVFTISMCI